MKQVINSMLGKLKQVLRESHLTRQQYTNLHQFYIKYVLSDEKFIKKVFKKNTGRKPDLINPVDFNEKMQWLKLNWYDPFAIKCADKYEVRNIVRKKAGQQYLNHIHDIFDSVEDIDIDKLPNSFVLKATHSSGHNFICHNKQEVNWKEQLKELKRWLKINYYWNTREWVYKDIKPRIICEQFLSEDKKSTSLTDYKFYCFNGSPLYCQVIKERSAGGTIDFFDMDWNHMEFTGLQKMPHSTDSIPKPRKLKEMIEIAKQLSGRFPFVRVDLYYVKEKVYFGELTFFPRSGFAEFDPSHWNEKMGQLIKLPTSR